MGANQLLPKRTVLRPSPSSLQAHADAAAALPPSSLQGPFFRADSTDRQAQALRRLMPEMRRLMRAVCTAFLPFHPYYNRPMNIGRFSSNSALN